MDDTQANEHFTPKPAHEHIPGAWNFVEPNPGLSTGSIGAQSITLEPGSVILEGSIDAHAIAAPPMEMRIKLSPEAREHLARTGLFNLEGPRDPAWQDIEDALTEIMLPPRRWVLGVY